MAITNESLVSELPGVSPPQAVALNRLGITRVGELIAADYESVAVTLESFDEATRILREAKRHIEVHATHRATAQNQAQHQAQSQAQAQAHAAAQARKSVANRQRPHQPAKPVQTTQPNHHQTAHASHQPTHQAARPAPQQQPARQQIRFAGDAVPQNPLTQEPVHDGNSKPRNGHREDSRPAPRDEEALGVALSLAGRGLDLNSGEEARASLSRRLGATTFLLEHEATEADAIAALILEGVEDGTFQSASITKTFGDEVAALVEECATIRAVPVSPLGKLPRYYMEMAQKASVSARRICAAHQIAHLHLNAEAAAAAGESRGGLVWYARLLLEALEAGGGDPVVSLLRSSVDALSRVAA